MSGRPWILLCVAAVLVASQGCSDEPPPRTELQVGVHRITVVVPDGWEHLDYGDAHQLRRELDRIAIADLGRLGGDLDAAADSALVVLRERERRHERSRSHWQIDGRQAVTVDTWDWLSHDFRKRFVFVANSGSLLAISMLGGQLETMAGAFDAVTASLAFVDSLGAADRSRQD